MESLFNPVKIVHVAQVVSFGNDWHHSIDLLTIDENSELQIFEECAYLKHQTLSDNSLSWRCARCSCIGRVRAIEDSVEIIQDHYHFPDPADIEKT